MPSLARQYAVVLVAAAGTRGQDVVFSVLVGAHVLAALAGFGSIGFAGFYGARAAQLGPEQPDEHIEELLRYFAGPPRLWVAIFAVPLLGLGALVEDPNGGGLGQPWAVAAVVVWLLAALVAAGLVIPSVNQVRAVLVAPTPPGAQARAPVDQVRAMLVARTPAGGPAAPAASAVPNTSAVPAASGPPVITDGAPASRLVRAGRLASEGAAACDLLFLVALALMVWQP